jgi:hypothetical protein
MPEQEGKKNEPKVSGFWGWTRRAKEFVSGIGDGALDGTILAGKDKAGPDVPAELHTAEMLMDVIVALASEVDNVINGADPKNAAECRNSASEIIDFIKNAYSRLKLIIENGVNGDMTSKTRQQNLEDIQKQYNIIIRPDGVLNKWKNEYLGSNREMMLNSEYLSRGMELVAQGDKVISEITNLGNLRSKIESTEIDSQIKRFKGAFSSPAAGESEQEREFKLSNAESVKSFRERLNKIGIENRATGDYGKEDEGPTMKAIQTIGAVTGKTYGNSNDAMRDLYNDAGKISIHREEIKKIILDK